MTPQAQGPRRLRVEHITGFSYQGEAGASYNEARMLPGSDARQFVLSAHLEVEPFAGTNSYIDYFGTRVASFEVLAPHSTLSITARSLVEVRPRPIEATGISWEELAAETSRAIATAEMLVCSERTAPHPELAELARAVAARADGPDAAARAIAEAVSERVEYVTGITGVHSTAVEAWRQRKGVCQDFAHITIGALREVGIPARYVSGYLHPREDAEIGEPVTGESHAWVEWFTGRWQGYDPTNRSEIGDRHVRVGRGRDYADVPPLRGIYDGPEGSTLHVRVTVTREA
ncbi:MAG: transglutaminase family protein [Leucobacter sp.]